MGNYTIVIYLPSYVSITTIIINISALANKSNWVHNSASYTYL
jgi:hypothetical protein